MSYTKGNWKEVEAFVISETSSKYISSKVDICSTSNVNNLPLLEQIANARLIAAAPDSVAACREARTAIQEALTVIREVLSQYGEYDAAGRRGKLPIEKTLENAFVKVETAITKSELGG